MILKLLMKNLNNIVLQIIRIHNYNHELPK
jgi:hypothetical protein